MSNKRAFLQWALRSLHYAALSEGVSLFHHTIFGLLYVQFPLNIFHLYKIKFSVFCIHSDLRRRMDYAIKTLVQNAFRNSLNNSFTWFNIHLICSCVSDYPLQMANSIFWLPNGYKYHKWHRFENPIYLNSTQRFSYSICFKIWILPLYDSILVPFMPNSFQ